jgi:hypothetical protein
MKFYIYFSNPQKKMNRTGNLHLLPVRNNG